MVICLERDADLHTAQLIPLPLTASCFSKIQIGFTFLVAAHPGSPDKRGLAQSPSCDCGQRQTMNHIVDMCPFKKFEGGLNLLHEADEDAVIWLESTATAALANMLQLRS